MKDFDYSKVPDNFGHCLQSNCKMGAHCLRYQATFHLPDTLPEFKALNPKQTNPEGECDKFLTDTPARFACGMQHLFDNVPYPYVKLIRNKLIDVIGRSEYYRLRDGERLISPEKQTSIKEVFQQLGMNHEPVFDSYCEELKWM